MWQKKQAIPPPISWYTVNRMMIGFRSADGIPRKTGLPTIGFYT